MARSIPLSRRLRAWRGRILLGAIWSGAAVFCVILAFFQPSGPTTVAVATRSTHAALAPESGRVMSVAVQPGQTVALGDVLATLEVPGLTSLIAAREAELRSVGEQGASSTADRMRKFATDVEATRVKLATAQAGLEKERALLAAAQADVRRATAPGVALSEQQVADLRATATAYEASVRGGEREVAALQAAYEAARARNAGVTPESVAAEVEALQAERDALVARSEALVLRATAPGVVSAAVPPVGQWVQSGMPVVTVEETATHDAVVYVDSVRALDVSPGDKVTVRPVSGGQLTGVVRTVGPAVEQVPVRQAHDPQFPEWGVPVTLTVAERPLMPGESLAVGF